MVYDDIRLESGYGIEKPRMDSFSLIQIMDVDGWLDLGHVGVLKHAKVRYGHPSSSTKNLERR